MGKPDLILAPEERRRLAEARVQHEERFERAAAQSETEQAELVDELRVHQIELEMQNDELRRAERSLYAAQARYFELIDLAPVCYLVLDDLGLVQEANLTSATPAGVLRSALLRQPITRFILKEDQDLLYKLRNRPIQEGQTGQGELRMVRKDGSVFWAHLTLAGAQDATGAPALRVVIADLSERKRAEEALWEACQFNEQIISSAQEGIIVYGLDLRYRVWNPYMETITGYAATKVIGGHPRVLFPMLLETGVLDNLEKVLTGRMVDPIDFAYAFPLTGRAGWATHTAAPLHNTRGEIIGVIAMVREISERMRNETLLLRKETELKESQGLAHIAGWEWDALKDEMYLVRGIRPHPGAGLPATDDAPGRQPRPLHARERLGP